MNPIIQRICNINTALDNLFREGETLRATQQKHIKDISDRRTKVESDYVALINSINEKENQALNIYNNEIDVENDLETSARSKCQDTIKENTKSIKSKYDNYINRDREYIYDLENKCRVCCNGNDKILKKYGMIPSCVTTKPNLPQLYGLFDRIMTDTSDSIVKRTLKKDGYYAQNDMIRDFISGSARAIAYLNYEISIIIPRDCQNEIQQMTINANASYQQSMAVVSASKSGSAQQLQNAKSNCSVLRKQAEIDKQQKLSALAALEKQYIAEEQQSIISAQNKRNAFFGTPLITSFAYEYQSLTVNAGLDDVDWNGYEIGRKAGKTFALGCIKLPVHTKSQMLLNSLKAKLPQYFDGTCFSIPLLFSNQRTSKIYIRYGTADKQEVYQNVQLFILQKMRSNPANQLKIFFCDPNDRGQNLGVLIAPNDKNEQIGIFARNTHEEINAVLKELEVHIDATNGVIGNCQSIYDYNAKNENKLKELVVVLCDVQDCVSYNDIVRLKVIWENAERYGINLILTSKTPVDSIEQCYENKNTDFAFLRQRTENTIMYDAVKRIIGWANESYSYTPATIGYVHKNFVANYREQIVESLKLNNKFSDVRDKMKVDYANDRQRKLGKSVDSVKLPVLINTETNKIDSDFEIGTSNDVHMLVTGGTGSGKSRFLFSIISSIAMNYHPDDVELWLIDCKINEFKPFIDKYKLPHIKMVALERTEEFCRAFFKYLSEVVAQRVKLFGEVGKKSFDEYRKAMNTPYCMPRIIIIVDEFHALVQVLNEDRKLKIEMENALAEYRSYGISFIFSDQSYEKITMSLQQVNCRIALRGDVENMKQTLRIKGDFPQQLEFDFKNSEGMGDIWWEKKLPTRFKNVFLPADQEAILFEEIANKWKSQVIHPKQPIYINGKERYFYDEIAAMCAIREKQAQLDEFDDYQMDLVLGQPTTFESYFSICMKQSRRENLLLLGESDLSIDVIGAVIKSLQYNGPIRIIAIGDRSDRNFKKFRRYVMNNYTNNVEIYYEYEDICNVVYELHQNIQSKKELRTKTVVFWFALNNLCEELGDFPQFRKESQQLVDVVPAPNQLNTFSEDEKNHFLAVAEELSIGDDDFDLSGLFQLVEPEHQVVAQKSVIDSDDSLYNACDDILTLFAAGSRFGLFNVVMLENLSDESKIKGETKRWDMEQFKHKIAFCMPRAYANSWNMTEASFLEEDMTALYSDGIKKTVFKPYYTVNKEEKT